MLRRRHSPPDRRGLAIGLVAFVAILGIAGLLYVLLNPAIDQLHSQMLTHSQTQQGTDELDQAKQIWNLVLFYFVFLAVLFLLAKAVVESRRPG